MTSKDLMKLGVIDAVIPEPLGGAHRNHHVMASRLKIFLRNCLRELGGVPLDQLVEARYQKFRRMGVFLEHAQLNGKMLNGAAPQDGQANGEPSGEETLAQEAVTQVDVARDFQSPRDDTL